jgi:hypothetical protein
MKLFKHDKVEDTFRDELPNADIRAGAMIVVASGLLMAMLAILILLERMHLLDFAFDVAAEPGMEVPLLIGKEQVLPFALFQLLFNAPVFILLTLVYEGLTFGIFRASGGEGSFGGHFYLSSLALLAMAISAGLGLLSPLPCFDILAGLALMILTVYLTLFVQVKAYQVAHGISFFHSLVVVALLAVPRFLVMTFITNAVSPLFGLPPSI